MLIAVEVIAAEWAGLSASRIAAKLKIRIEKGCKNKNLVFSHRGF